MNLKDFQQDLETLVNRHSLDTLFNLPDFAISDYIMDSLNALLKANKLKPTSDSVDEFIDRMYKLYPSHCPKRNASLGKTKKDKERIKRLLKVYSMEEIERVIKNEIETKQGKAYMQNFSTFLNNFPDPQMLDSGNLFGVRITEEPNSYKCFNETLNIDGQIYR